MPFLHCFNSVILKVGANSVENGIKLILFGDYMDDSQIIKNYQIIFVRGKLANNLFYLSIIPFFNYKE